MNNIFTLHQRSRRPIALPQTPPAQYGTALNGTVLPGPHRLGEREVLALSQFRIFALAHLSPAKQEELNEIFRLFVEQRR